MDLHILLIIIVFATTILASITPDLKDVQSNVFDMNQIRIAIANSDRIAKIRGNIKYEMRAHPEEIVQFYCANYKEKIFTHTYFDDPEMSTKIDIKRPIVFIIHGWMSRSTVQWATELSETWINNVDTNICRVDWSNYANAGYITVAITNTRKAAAGIATFIKKLVQNYSMPWKEITVVGHSIGAHVAGFIGQITSSRIGKIYGLDPAGALFTVPTVQPENNRLDPTDAQKVVVVHSSDGVLGVNIACGHQDFYANRGTYPQPGCIWPNVKETFEGRKDSVQCSHLRAVQYLIESLKPNNECNAIRCSSIINYMGRTCNGTSEFLALNNNGPDGKYYFKTNNSKCTGSYFS